MDRVAGLVYGAALGDAIGLATEFMTREECQFYYGMNGERLSLRSIIVDRHRSKWRKGDWTDDTDQLVSFQPVFGHQSSSFYHAGTGCIPFSVTKVEVNEHLDCWYNSMSVQYVPGELMDMLCRP